MFVSCCRRSSPAGPDRLAVLPAAVLIGDPGQQWLATAVPLILQQDLATSNLLATTFVPNASGAYQLEATRILHSTVEQRKGRLRIEATITSLATQQTIETLEGEGPVSGGVIPLLDSLAKKLDPARASIFSTRKDEALKLFAAAVNSADAATRTQSLEAAVQADPNFGLAQIARIENAPQSSAALAVPAASFVALDRVRWMSLVARLHHAPLSKLIETEAAVVQLAPNNVEALGALGLHRFLQGDGVEGKRLLQKAIAINPANVNLSVQLAQGFVAVHQFAEAVKILESLSASNPTLLPPLALVQLLNGKRSEADAAFKRFLSFLPGASPAVPALETQWQHFTTPDATQVPAQSVEFWQTAVNESGDTNLLALAMLAAALRHAGLLQEAGKIHVQPFIPEFTDPNAAIALHEIRRTLNRR